jgi:hypothetical protein
VTRCLEGRIGLAPLPAKLAKVLVRLYQVVPARPSDISQYRPVVARKWHDASTRLEKVTLRLLGGIGTLGLLA